MSTSFGIARSLFSLSASALLVLSLSACEKKAEAPTPSTSADSAATGTSSTSPTATVTPHSGDLAPSSSAKGPSEAGTAIGGMVGEQEKGGAKEGGAPAKTGGDAAPSK